MDTSVWRSLTRRRFHKVLRDRLENTASVVVMLCFHLLGAMQSNTGTFVNSVATAGTNLSDSQQIFMSCFFFFFSVAI